MGWGFGSVLHACQVHVRLATLYCRGLLTGCSGYSMGACYMKLLHVGMYEGMCPSNHTGAAVECMSKCRLHHWWDPQQLQ